MTMSTDGTYHVCSVYKNDKTGHWMVDRFGTKVHPSGPMSKEGFRTFDGACKAAAELVNYYSLRYPHMIRGRPSRKRAS